MTMTDHTRALTLVLDGTGKTGRGEDEAVACEKALAGSGADRTVLRCSWFDQNFSESYLLELVVSGHVSLPAPAVGEPFADADDIATSRPPCSPRPGIQGRPMSRPARGCSPPRCQPPLSLIEA
jgi:hypothetical protein